MTAGKRGLQGAYRYREGKCLNESGEEGTNLDT